jgi:hypothetical protein
MKSKERAPDRIWGWGGVEWVFLRRSDAPVGLKDLLRGHRNKNTIFTSLNKKNTISAFGFFSYIHPLIHMVYLLQPSMNSIKGEVNG